MSLWGIVVLLAAIWAWPACTPAKAPVAANQPEAGADLANLPRFQRLWSREGIGHYEGIAAGGVYYTVGDDGRAVHAMDLASGRSLWQTPLPQPMVSWAYLAIFARGLVLVYRLHAEEQSGETVVARLSLNDGQLVWSKVVVCKGLASPLVGDRFFLECERSGRRTPELLEIDPLQGTQLARIPLDDRVELAAGGRLCGLSETHLFCGRITKNRFEVVWKEPKRSSLSDIDVAGEWVVAADDVELVVRRVKDGGLVWKRAGRYFGARTDGAARVVLMGRAFFEVVRLSDGVVLARIPKLNENGGTTFSGEGWIVIHHYGGERAVHLVDAESRWHAIASNVKQVHQLLGGMLLTRNAASLQAYSLTEFALPYARLGPYEQVLAVLEMNPSSWESHSAIRALRPIRGWQASIERVIAQGPEQLKEAAIAAAGESGDPRFVAPLRQQLDAVRVPIAADEEWSRIVTLGIALEDIESPEAAEALIAFSQRVGPRLLPWRREVLRDWVSSAIWRYSARKEWVSCENTVVLPVTRVARKQAILGTASPGIPYAVNRNGDWAAICQARTDDDGNGRLEVRTEHHGDTSGDQLEPYLVLGAGPGTKIDDFVGSDVHGRWIAMIQNLCLYLVDAQSGKAVALRGADGRPGDARIGAHRAAAFSPDGKGMLYIKSNGDRATVMYRDLASGAEQSIDPGRGKLRRVFFNSSGRLVVMELVTEDTDRDGRLRTPVVGTTLGERRCRGEAASASFFGPLGDKTIQRTWPIGGGNVEEVPRNESVREAQIPSPNFRLVREGKSSGELEAPLPIGPFRWQID